MENDNENVKDQQLPVEHDWLKKTKITETVTLIDQPFVHPFLRANMWHIRGKNMDLLIDCGLGVIPIRRQILDWFGREPVLVLTHSHLDHMGSAYEFQDCWANEIECIDGSNYIDGTKCMVESTSASLFTTPCMESLGIPSDILPPSLPNLMILASPYPDYNPEEYKLRRAPVTRLLNEGDVIDLGDRTLEVSLMPGHSPGSIALFDNVSKEFFSGDVVYDDYDLVDYAYGSDKAVYISTMTRLLSLPARTIYAGHGSVIDGDRMKFIASEYIKLSSN